VTTSYYRLTREEEERVEIPAEVFTPGDRTRVVNKGSRMYRIAGNGTLLILRAGAVLSRLGGDAEILSNRDFTHCFWTWFLAFFPNGMPITNCMGTAVRGAGGCVSAPEISFNGITFGRVHVRCRRRLL